VSEIRIHREHDLGLEEARKIALQWAEEAERKFGMDCTVVEGEYSDTVAFSRSGVRGQLVVAADHFDLQAQLGFLLGAFSKTIETEIEKNLDALLGARRAQATAPKAAASGAAKKAAAKKSGGSNGGRKKA